MIIEARVAPRRNEKYTYEYRYQSAVVAHRWKGENAKVTLRMQKRSGDTYQSADDATWIDVDRDPVVAAISLAHRDVAAGVTSKGCRAESLVDSLSLSVVVLAYGAIPFPIVHLGHRNLGGETHVSEEVRADDRQCLKERGPARGRAPRRVGALPLRSFMRPFRGAAGVRPAGAIDRSPLDGRRATWTK